MRHISAKKRTHRRRKKKKYIAFLAVVFVLTGILVFLYPFVSNYFAQKQQENVIIGQQETIQNSDEELLREEWEKAKNYNQTFENYMDTLNLAGDGVMGVIEIPKIELRIPIYHGSEEASLRKGIGHVKETALPIGGLGNHTVLIGHRGLPESELFTRLDEIEMGDRFYVSVLDKIFSYEVDQIKIVLPEEAGKIKAERNKELITLVTCTPYGVNTHRLLVRGTRIENTKEKRPDLIKDKEITPLTPAY